MSSFHFLRPWWGLAWIVLAASVWFFSKNNRSLTAWSEVCDRHLLEHLMVTKGESLRARAISFLIISAAFMIISLMGPCWSKFPVPSYKTLHPRVVVLDLSDAMLADDLSPTRLERAKFKLRDLFKNKDIGQWGLVVYTGEPFVVSPLTDDGQTISALLASLTPDIMPVRGQRLDLALNQAEKLITQAGFKKGDVLVMTGETPTNAAIDKAANLAQANIHTSIIPILKRPPTNSLFERFANAGDGEVFSFADGSTDIKHWLERSGSSKVFHANLEDDVPLWRDEGRWFLIPALLFLLAPFRRGWLQRICA